MESFFAWAMGVFGVMMETGALGMMCCGVRVVTDGREAAGLGDEVEVEGAVAFAVAVAVEAARDERGVARAVVVVLSALGREATEGRFGATGAAGAAVAAAVPAPPMVLRTAGFLFSSAEARVGGLFRLEAVPARREVEPASALDALLGGRVVVLVLVLVLAVDADAEAAVGRRAPPAAAVAVPGRRGGTGSFLGACEAIFRRRTDDGDDGGGSEVLGLLMGCDVGLLAAALLRVAPPPEVLDPSAAMAVLAAIRGASAPSCGFSWALGGGRRAASSKLATPCAVTDDEQLRQVGWGAPCRRVQCCLPALASQQQ